MRVLLAISISFLSCTLIAQPLSRAQIHKLVAQGAVRAKVKWNKEDHEALVKIIWRESSFDPHCTTSRSSSAGLLGFLSSTRRAYGLSIHSSLVDQVAAGWKYCVRRYGSPSKAWQHHKNHNWY